MVLVPKITRICSIPMYKEMYINESLTFNRDSFHITNKAAVCAAAP